MKMTQIGDTPLSISIYSVRLLTNRIPSFFGIRF